ncbi:MAG TPA: hypothetical protein VLZ89_04900, partial [Anaerolineales bacterium]|nr:hypothetical protein [Anaerolineales bacterium]
DWSFLQKHEEIFRFTCGMIAFRRGHPVLSREQFYSAAEVQWFGPQGGPPNWADGNAKQCACLIHEDEQQALYLMFNAGAEAVDFRLPPAEPEVQWRLALDTARAAPQDLFAEGTEPPLEDPRSYRLGPRSSVILLTRSTNRQRQQNTWKEAQ